jgi:SdpC family antimicrobial peptide
MHRKGKLWVAALLSFLVVGCGQGSGVGTAFSDRQIFEGVMFGAGPVANLLPEARDHLRPELYARSPDELNAMADARASIIEAIERAQPGFLAAFASAARSGDPAQVQMMIDRAIRAISERVPGEGIPSANVLDNLPIDHHSTRSSAVPSANLLDNLPVDHHSTRSPAIPSANVLDNLPVDHHSTRSPAIPSANVLDNLPVDHHSTRSSAVPAPAVLFSSGLFTEQLANSAAVTLGRQPAVER